MAQEANRSQGPMLCTMGCGFYGNPRTNGMCSVCYKEHLQRQNAGGRLSPTATSPGNSGAVAVAQAAADSLASSTATVAVAAAVSSPSSVAPATSGSASPLPAPSPSPSSTSLSSAAAAAAAATAASSAVMTGTAMATANMMVTAARVEGSPATTPTPQQEPSQAEAPSPGVFGSPSSPITSQPSPVSSRMTAMTLVADGEDVVTTDQPVAAATSADLSACTLADLDGAEGSPEGADKPRQQKKNRCHTCRKKVGLTAGFECRCGNLFCGLHRYSDKHECSYDYKSEAAEKIRKENPIVVSEKIQKI